MYNEEKCTIINDQFSSMEEQLNQLEQDFEKVLDSAKNEQDLETVRVEFLGRKGKLSELMKGLKDLDGNDRKLIGQVANKIKETMEKKFLAAKRKLEAAQAGEVEQEEWLDITLPGLAPRRGHLHPVTQAINEITDIFSRIGFVRASFPEADWDYYAFESLNMPADHPARDEWETFFIDAPEGKKGKIVLTPHTSNSQVRDMENQELPIRMINIGKCYRRQSDVSHSQMFHQFEGLMIDKDVSVTHLRGVMDYFVKSYFGSSRVTRLRPFHFRFTEPSFELDISCDACKGTGRIDGAVCRLCKEGWLELGGAGMVHPNVLKAGGIDPEKYSGFAFGWGVERTMMMKEGTSIADIRILYKNNLKFLEQF